MEKVLLITYTVLQITLLVALPRCDAALFHVEGRVYCDTCRVQFETSLSEPLEGAEVELKCKNSETEKVVATAKAKSDKEGKYLISIDGDYAKDICEVTVTSSPRSDCNDPMDEHARIVCTKNVGITGDRRYANPIGYMKKNALPGCNDVLAELGYIAKND